MYFDYYVQIVSAVVIGNALTFGYGYALWCFTQAEKRGIPTTSLSWWLYFCGIIGPVVAAVGIYMTTT